MIAETKSSKPILLRRPRPFRDESISGFMIRLAEANGHTVTVMTAITGLKHNKKGYVYGVTPLNEFSRVTNVPEQELKDLAYKPINSHSPQITGEYEIFGQIIPVLTIRYKTPKLCPECLKESPYQRKVWDLSPVTACPHHKCLLLDACPKCEKKISHLRSQVCVCNCGFDFRKAAVSSVADEELALTRRIYELFDLQLNGEAAKAIQTHQLPDSLRDLNLSGLLSVLFFIMRHRHDNFAGKKIYSLSNGELHESLAEAVKVFDDFPNNFYNFLDKVKKRLHRKTNDSKKPGVGDRQGISHRGMILFAAEIKKNAHLEFTREALNEYWNREKLNSYGIILDYEQTTANKFFEEYTALHAAAKILKNTKMVCREMIQTGVLRAYEGVLPSKKQICYISTKDICDVKRRLEDVISVTDAAKLLGLQQFHVDPLIDGGILKVITDLKISPLYTRITSRQRAIEVYEVFHKAMLANPAYKRAESAKIRWHDALMRLGKIGIDFGEVVKSVYENKLAPAGIDKSRKGLMSFLYDKSQIEKIISERMPVLLAGTCSMREISDLMKIKQEIVRSLLKKNYLHKVRLKGYIHWRIPAECVDEFRREYVLSSEISRKFSTNTDYVNRKLTERNISPVDLIFAPHNYLYRRADVEDIVIETVRKKSREMPHRAKQIHTLEETAKILKITPGKLLLAVERNLISLFKSRNDSELRFSDDRIETFKNLNLPNLDYVKPDEAARIMKMQLKTFKTYYLSSKRIIPLVREFGKKGKLYFFSIGDLEKLKKLEAECIGSLEVSRMLNIPPGTIAVMTSDGRLKPISGPSIDGYHKYRFLKSGIEEIKRKEIKLKKAERRS